VYRGRLARIEDAMTTFTSLSFSHSTRDGVLVIELHGAIDSALALDSLSDLVQQSAAGNVVVVISGVEYINSAGFSALIRLSEIVTQQKKSIYVVGLESKVHVVFNSLGAQDLFNILPDLDTALSRIAAGKH
jgi:anti-anti-sigma factor